MPRINGLNAHSTHTHAHADYTCGLNGFCNSAVQLCAASGKKQNNVLLSNWSLLILVSKTAAFASKHKNEPCDSSKTDSHDQILTFSKNLSLDNQNYSMTAWLAKNLLRGQRNCMQVNDGTWTHVLRMPESFQACFPAVNSSVWRSGVRSPFEYGGLFKFKS